MIPGGASPPPIIIISIINHKEIYIVVYQTGIFIAVIHEAAATPGDV
jgi:hypothetical protein